MEHLEVILKHLMSLGLFNLEKRRLREDLIVAYNSSQEEEEGQAPDLFYVMTSDMTRGYGLKLCQKSFRLNVRKICFLLGTGTGSHAGYRTAAVVTTPSLTKVHEAFEQCSQAYGINLGDVLCRDRS